MHCIALFNRGREANQCVLGVCFLDQRHPELVGLRPIASVNEFAVDGRQTVVDVNLHPASKVPEHEPKYS